MKPTALVTAGPTREYIDPVRYLSNASSGKMGFALAHALHRAGFRVTLIAGPVDLSTPKGVKRIDVVTAVDMRRQVLIAAKKADIIFMTAAVTDWRPFQRYSTKMKRTRSRGEQAIILKTNPDILAQLGKRKKPSQTLVGFCVETNNLERNARQKLREKKCDWIVANKATSIGSNTSQALLIHKNGKTSTLPQLPKNKLATRILSYVLRGHPRHPEGRGRGGRGQRRAVL